MGVFVKCPQCVNCKERTDRSECRKDCFAFKVALAKAYKSKAKRDKIKQEKMREALYIAYENEAM